MAVIPYSVTNPFKFTRKGPLDVRLEVETIDNLNDDKLLLYPGMVRYVKETDEFFKYTAEKTWVSFPGINIPVETMFYYGEVTALQFDAIDVSTLKKNSSFVITEEYGNYKENCLVIYNGNGWIFTLPEKETIEILHACATPAVKEGEEFELYKKIMSALAWLEDDTQVVTVGALKVILGLLLSNYPIFIDVENLNV